MGIALITLSSEGAALIDRIVEEIPHAEVYLHEKIPKRREFTRFRQISILSAELFTRYQELVYIAPIGLVVRAIAGELKHKKIDPAIVVVDAGGRFAVSLLSAHEGGGNGLAFKIGNIIGAEPVITTTSEARKSLIVGVGCRRSTSSERIVSAVLKAIEGIGADIGQVRMLASADIKAGEVGLVEAARVLDLPIRFIRSEEIRSSTRAFGRSEFVEEKVNLPAVAEAAALLGGRSTRLILEKTIFNGITIAIARENFLWSGSAPEVP